MRPPDGAGSSGGPSDGDLIGMQTNNPMFEELARLMNAQEDDPALVEALLTGRNRKWAEWIGNRLEEPGTVFLAVGAGHLAGEGSVQDQLSANGIAAERLQ